MQALNIRSLTGLSDRFGVVYFPCRFNSPATEHRKLVESFSLTRSLSTGLRMLCLHLNFRSEDFHSFAQYTI